SSCVLELASPHHQPARHRRRLPHRRHGGRGNGIQHSRSRAAHGARGADTGLFRGSGRHAVLRRRGRHHEFPGRRRHRGGRSKGQAVSAGVEALATRGRLSLMARLPTTLVVGGGIVVFWLLVAIFGPLLSPYDPIAIDIAHALLPPSRLHWLGTDSFGRDLVT